MKEDKNNKTKEELRKVLLGEDKEFLKALISGGSDSPEFKEKQNRMLELMGLKK